MDKTLGNQLQVILKKLKATNPKRQPSLEDYVKVCVDEWYIDNAPITHTPYWAVSPHIGDTGEHGETQEGIGNDTGRSGEKWVEAGRSGEPTPPPPHLTGPYWKNAGRSWRSGSNTGDTGTTWELYGSNTAQSGITRGNTGDFSPSRMCLNWGSKLSQCPKRSLLSARFHGLTHICLCTGSRYLLLLLADIPIEKNRSCGHRVASFAPNLANIGKKFGGLCPNKHSWSAHPLLIGRCPERFNSQLNFAGWSADVTQINSSARGMPPGRLPASAQLHSYAAGKLSPCYVR